MSLIIRALNISFMEAEPVTENVLCCRVHAEETWVLLSVSKSWWCHAGSILRFLCEGKGAVRWEAARMLSVSQQGREMPVSRERPEKHGTKTSGR